MPKRPSNLIFSLEDSPPLGLNFSLSFQHVVVGLMYMVYPVLLMNEVGASVLQTQRLVSAALLTIGVATILQSLHKGPVGSGFLAIQVTNPIFLPLSIQAAHLGGIGLVFGMLIVVGITQSLFSQTFQRLRALFPPEVCGIVIAMLGISMVGVAVKRFTGFEGSPETITPENITIALLTLSVMLGLSIWFRGYLRLFAIMIGILFGYAISYACGLIAPSDLSGLRDAQLLAPPQLHLPAHGFSWTLFLPFLITAIVSSIDTTGGLITCQKMNDASWIRPDLRSVSRGVLADGFGNILAGVAGGFAVGVSSANVGLAMASGATSRKIATYAGIMFIMIALLPKASFSISLIPKPVMGAVLVYVASFLIVSGIELISSRMLDDRRTAMVGLSIVAGLSVEVAPELYENVPSWAEPFFISSLALASLTAIVLNLIFRLGISQKAEITLQPQDKAWETLYRFMENLGSGWGARDEIIREAILVVTECVETIRSNEPDQVPVKIEVRFDEYNLDITIKYRGMPLQFPSVRPSPEKILENDKALMDLSGYLVQHYADKVNISQKGNLCVIALHFDH